jgi:hypothetical protein
MSYENINLENPNFTFYSGYFYSFDEIGDVLFQKTDDGTTAFSYPLDTVLEHEIVSTEHDGVNFWTLEKEGDDETAYIRRWRIENYICKLKETFTMYEAGVHLYDSDAFTVEHYHSTISGTTSSGTSVVYVYDDFTSQLSAGMEVTLGPNTNGEFETRQVQNIYSDRVTLVSGTSYNYVDADDFQFYNYVWLFNNYDGVDSSTGALYKIDAYDGSYVSKTEGGEFKDVKSTTFHSVDVFTDYGEVEALCYVKASNLLFVNISDMSYYGSMAMDNVKSDNTVIVVYDLVIDGENVYRLQTQAVYYGTPQSWTNYNYQLGALHSFVASIAISASPGVIAANGISTSTITATVRDQFRQPVSGRAVNFTEDDPVGGLSPSSPGTNSEGQVTTVYTSGTDARQVTITATVQQS